MQERSVEICRNCRGKGYTELPSHHFNGEDYVDIVDRIDCLTCGGTGVKVEPMERPDHTHNRR